VATDPASGRKYERRYTAIKYILVRATPLAGHRTFNVLFMTANEAGGVY